MAIGVQGVSNWNRSLWRLGMWGGAVGLLLLPAVAMQFAAEVAWGPGDFAIMAALFALCCGTVEVGARLSSSWSYRAGVGIAVLISFVLVWMNLAAGILGAEDNPANLMFGGPILAAAGGALLAGGRAAGMGKAMVAAAAMQAAVAGIALAGDMGAGEPVWPWGFAALMAFFAVLWLSAAWLFRMAARATPGSR